MEELRIVLLGKQGAGKSSTGNTLLGSKHFHTAPSSQRVTQTCSKITGTIDGHRISVVDTPGWTDLSLMEDETSQEIAECIDLTDPGPHVFLLVLPIGRFTKEEINTAQQILEVFGEEATKFTMVLFTRGDDLEKKTIEEYLKGVHPDLKKILEVCGGRYHVFNNRDMKNPKQVSELLKKIKRTVKRNKGKYYTKAMFQKMADEMEQQRKRQKMFMPMMEEECRKIMRNSAIGIRNGAVNRKSPEWKNDSDIEVAASEMRRERERKRYERDRTEESERKVEYNRDGKLVHKRLSNQGDKSWKDGEQLQSNAERSKNYSKDDAELRRLIERVEKNCMKEIDKQRQEIYWLRIKLDNVTKELREYKEAQKQTEESDKPRRANGLRKGIKFLRRSFKRSHRYELRDTF